MHILIASDTDFEAVCNLKPGESWPWVVPKGAAAGDVCLLSHGGIGIFAYGYLEHDAQHDPMAARKYRAQLGEIEVLGQSIPHSLLSTLWPSWGWPTYPRSYTTISGDIEDELLALAGDFLDVGDEVAEDTAIEGAAVVRMHQVRERDPELAARKRARVLRETGRLACEVCSFDFKAFYGEHGQGFAEVHHTRPLGTRAEAEPTTLEELVILCSNCHRMIHRRGLIGVQELRAIVANAANPLFEPTAFGGG